MHNLHCPLFIQTMDIHDEQCYSIVDNRAVIIWLFIRCAQRSFLLRFSGIEPLIEINDPLHMTSQTEIAPSLSERRQIIGRQLLCARDSSTLAAEYNILYLWYSVMHSTLSHAHFTQLLAPTISRNSWASFFVGEFMIAQNRFLDLFSVYLSQSLMVLPEL